MKKLSLSVLILLLSIFAIGYGYAIFSDLVIADENKFYAGIFQIQISDTDTNSDQVADTLIQYWSDTTSNTWSSSQYWVPGQTVESQIFVRNTGEIDADAVLMTMTDRIYYGEKHLDEVINLIDAWYDRNANGVMDEGENLLPTFEASYDTNADGLTLVELFAGLDVVHNGAMFDLEAGEAVLPGLITDDLIGGINGTGKGLFFTWQFDPEAGIEYQNCTVKLDFEFYGQQTTY